MNKISSKIIISALFVFLLAVSITPVFAQDGPNLGFNYAANLELQTQNGDVRDAAISIIRYLMTFLGIIATVIILLGGFRWLTAAGNEDRIAEAKKTIIAGIIGLIIILAAFAIVTFVVQVTQDSVLGAP